LSILRSNQFWSIIRLISFALIVTGEVFPGWSSADQNLGRSAVFVRVERTFHHKGFQTHGTGVLVHDSGFVLTNALVVDDHFDIPDEHASVNVSAPIDRIIVVIDSGLESEREMPARVISVDFQRDLALLKINCRTNFYEDFRSISDVLPGDSIFVAGFPFPRMKPISLGVVATKQDNPSIVTSLGEVSGKDLPAGECIDRFRYNTSNGWDEENSVVLNQDGRLVGFGISATKDAHNQKEAVSGCRIREFLVQNGVRISLDPGVVMAPPQPIRITVEPTLVPIEAIKGDVFLEGDDIEPMKLDLVSGDGRLSGTIIFPPRIEGRTPPLRYFATVRLSSDFVAGTVLIRRSLDVVPGSLIGSPHGAPSEPSGYPLIEETEIIALGQKGQKKDQGDKLSSYAESTTLQVPVFDPEETGPERRTSGTRTTIGRYENIKDPYLKALVQEFDFLRNEIREANEMFDETTDYPVRFENAWWAPSAMPFVKRLSVVTRIMADRGVRWCKDIEVYYVIDSDPENDPCRGLIILF